FLTTLSSHLILSQPQFSRTLLNSPLSGRRLRVHRLSMRPDFKKIMIAETHVRSEMLAVFGDATC
ncbi:MAG: hypothetical protein WA517_02255, partial [Candidatus Acidiferrum sp.]